MSTSVALFWESIDHKNDTDKVIHKENIHFVAIASFMVNLVNLLVLHNIKTGMKGHSNSCSHSHLEISAKVDTNKTALSLDQPNDVSTATTSPTRDSVMMHSMDKKESTKYQSKASHDIIFVTFVHLFFDMAIRLSVVFSSVMIRFFDYDAFDYYCSFLIAAVMGITVIPLLANTLKNIRAIPYPFSELIPGISTQEEVELRRNAMEISEGDQKILLINGMSELKHRANEDMAVTFCQNHGLDKIIWEERKGK